MTANARYAYLLDRAFALEAGKDFTIEAGQFGNYGLWDRRVGVATAANRVRVYLHKHAQAKRKNIHVRMAANGKDLQVYRRKS